MKKVLLFTTIMGLAVAGSAHALLSGSSTGTGGGFIKPTTTTTATGSTSYTGTTTGTVVNYKYQPYACPSGLSFTLSAADGWQQAGQAPFGVPQTKEVVSNTELKCSTGFGMGVLQKPVPSGYRAYCIASGTNVKCYTRKPNSSNPSPHYVEFSCPSASVSVVFVGGANWTMDPSSPTSLASRGADSVFSGTEYTAVSCYYAANSAPPPFVSKMKVTLPYAICSVKDSTTFNCQYR